MGVGLNPAGRFVGRYELLEYLGSGGMSDVFIALHQGLRRRVALKLLRPALRRDREAVQRFLREGQCAARVCHPNVVDVLDVGLEQDIPFLVMELLDGETLERKLQRTGQFSLHAAVDLILPIVDGVAAVHAAGVLHRDIKPANVLLARMPDGSVVPKLLDFGIATLEERRGITGALGPIGTPHYMSPEQARGARGIDERSDQYSIASMLYELLTGREPFAGGDIPEVLERVARGKFPRARDRRPELPAPLEEVLARATALDPAKRFVNVSALAEALVPFASARTKKLWISRAERDGVLSAQLLSGAFHTEIATEVTRITPVLASRAATTSAGGRGYTPSFWALAVGVIALGLGVGYLRSRTLAEEEVILPARQAEVAAGPHVREHMVTPQRVYLTPADAHVTLDGVTLGRGDFTAPTFADEAVHELRIAAEGFVTRVMLFRGSFEPTHVMLEPVAQLER